MVIPASENPTPARRPENTRDRVLLTALAIPWLAEVAQIVADFTPKRRANRKISRFFGSENDLRSM